ncbi:MAG: response regulator [Lachnospiraceae bacterium]|nr:response regulator [Lachnospiraceae bacterium]
MGLETKTGSRKEKLSVLGRILLFVFIIVFFVSIVFVYYLMIYSETRENIINRGQINAIESADKINLKITSSLDIVKLASYTLDNMIRDGRSNEEIVDYLTTETLAVQDSLIADTTGIYGFIKGEYMDGSGWIPDDDYNPLERPWYIAGKAGNGRIVIVDPYLDVYTGKVMITVVKTLCDAKSVVGLDLSMDEIQTFVKERVAQGRSSAEFIINNTGLIISHSDAALLGTYYDDVSNALGHVISQKMQSTSDTFFYLEFEDKDYLVYIMPLENEWTSISVIDASEDFDKLLAPLIITIVIAIVLVLVLGFFMVRGEIRARQASELAIKSETATAASEAKSAFLSNMSHEIRTPINAILGMNEMVIRETDDAAILSYSDNIKTAGGTLLGIINDILDFSKIEAGRIEIIPVDYEVSTIIRDLVNMICSRAEDKGLLLNLEFDPNIPKTLYGDEVRIKQVITNILTNAVKYTEQGSVTFRMGYEKITSDENSIKLNVSVEDTGIGIKEEDLNKLFSEFERIEEKRNRNIEGTGLGMSITKSLLELMGSSLKVESTYGKGSKFSFSLIQKVVDPEPMGDYKDSCRTLAVEREKYHEKFTAPDAKVLVVDDNEMNLKVFISLIKKTKIQCDTADSGDQGIAMTKENKYDMIFLDHMMPGKDGIETLHEMMGLEGNPNLDVPKICLTANAISGAREKYLAEGFDDYLTKPIDPDTLEEMLARYLPGEKIMPAESDAGNEKEADREPEKIDPRCEKMLTMLKGITQINEDIGIDNTGSPTEYLQILQIFYGTIDEKIEEMTGLLAEEKIKDFTIKMHAFKSSAKIVGANQLGEDAQQLENAAKSEDLEYISGHYGSFSKNCMRLKDLLDKVLYIPEENTEQKPEADVLLMANTYQEIREAAQDMDCDRLDTIFREMTEFTIPASDKALFGKLKLASDNFEYDKIIKLLDDNNK